MTTQSVQRKETRDYIVRHAHPNDRAAVEALFDRPMPGPIHLTTRPKYFCGTQPDHQTIHEVVIESSHSGIVAYAQRRVLEINGSKGPTRVGYLGALRVKEDIRSSRRAVAIAFEKLFDTRQPDELPFDLTSILTDNTAARRAFERGIHGLPIYTLIGDLVTLTVPARQRGKQQALANSNLSAQYALSMDDLFARPVWHNQDPSPFVAEGNALGRVRLATTDPIAADYDSWIRQSRWLINTACRITHRATLPPVGQPMRLAFLTHLSFRPNDSSSLCRIIHKAASVAWQLGARRLAVGLPDTDTARQVARSLRAWVTPSRIYAVHQGDLPSIDGTCWPEVADL